MKKRLIRLENRPRENRRKVTFSLEISLERDNSDGEASGDLKKFKEWVQNRFTQWDESILQYYLYEYNLKQDPDNTKYFLDFKVTDLINDDSTEENNNMAVDEENKEKKDSNK